MHDTFVIDTRPVLCLQSDGASDEQKREQMEKLVREELERWDSESSIGGSGRGMSPGGSSRRGGATSSVSSDITLIDLHV